MEGASKRPRTDIPDTEFTYAKRNNPLSGMSRDDLETLIRTCVSPEDPFPGWESKPNGQSMVHIEYNGIPLTINHYITTRTVMFQGKNAKVALDAFVYKRKHSGLRDTAEKQPPKEDPDL